MTTATSDIQLREQQEHRDLLKIITQGDLVAMSAPQRVQYYNSLCAHFGFEPITRPFDWIEEGKDDKKKLTLYANKSCATQLRSKNQISVKVVDRTKIGDLFVVTASASTPSGRVDESIGAVPIVIEEVVWVDNDRGSGRHPEPTGRMIALTGDKLANAIMKAETKAKRRVTLSICGMAMLDESELEYRIVDGTRTEDGVTVINTETPVQHKPAISRSSQVISGIKDKVAPREPEKKPEVVATQEPTIETSIGNLPTSTIAPLKTEPAKETVVEQAPAGADEVVKARLLHFRNKIKKDMSLTNDVARDHLLAMMQFMDIKRVDLTDDHYATMLNKAIEDATGKKEWAAVLANYKPET